MSSSISKKPVIPSLKMANIKKTEKSADETTTERLSEGLNPFFSEKDAVKAQAIKQVINLTICALGNKNKVKQSKEECENAKTERLDENIIKEYNGMIEVFRGQLAEIKTRSSYETELIKYTEIQIQHLERAKQLALKELRTQEKLESETK